ncbi:MAG: helix-turn-helix domain-containing protein [Sporolactobacillus sp.]
MKTMARLECFNCIERAWASTHAYAVVMVIAGSVQFEHDGGIVVLHEDDIIMLNPHVEATFCSRVDNILLMLIIDRSKIEELMECGWPYRYRTSLSQYSDEYPLLQLHKDLVSIVRATYERKNGYELEVNQRTLSILHNLNAHFMEPATTLSHAPELSSDQRLAGIITYIEKNYKRPLSLQALAKKFYLSAPYLSRMFKKQTGLTFTEYLNAARLKHVIAELPFSNEAISKLALVHGFSNLKSFYRVYNSNYKLSPSAYRKKHRGVRVSTIHTSDYRPLALEETVHALSKRLVQRTDGAFPAQQCEQYILDVRVSGQRPFRLAGQIVKISDAVAVTAMMKEEIAELNKRIGFDYVLFSLDPQQLEVERSRFDLFLLLDFIVGQQMQPLIRLSCPSSQIEQLINFFVECGNRYGQRQLSGWHVFSMLAGASPAATSERLDSHVRLCRELRRLHINLKLGTDSIVSDQKQVIQAFIERWQVLQQCEALPDFLVFSALYADVDSVHEPEEQDYRRINDYAQHVLSELKKALHACHAACPALILDGWNTLAKSNQVAAGTFYRTALIARCLLALAGGLSAVSFWLDTAHEANRKHLLSLYLYGLLNLPVFFAVELLNKMEGDIIFNDGQRVLLTRHGDDYQLLVMNPCLFNPNYAVDQLTVERSTLSMRVTLNGFADETTNYAIKKYTLDRDHGGLYNEQLRLGSVGAFDHEFQAYLEKIVTPRMELIKAPIHGDYVIQTELTANALEIYTFKKIQKGYL